MLETGSVFDVLASDDSDRRLAQRKALALSQARLDTTMGRFLTGAVTMEEFQARMAAVQDDFARHVAEASAEVGYDQPERLIPVLTSHYERNRRWQPKHAFGEPQVQYDGPAYPDAGNEDSYLGPPDFPNGNPNTPGNCPTCGSHNVDPMAQTCMDCGFNGNPGHRYEGDMGGYQPVFQPTAQDIGEKVDPSEMQDSNDGKGVNEPHQDDEDASAPKIKSSAEGNTDLGGPEPKMDKRLWEPSNLGDPDVADGRWPTERVDMTEPIGPPANDHELSGIGEKFTESQNLPSETENSGFQSGGPGPAPHTDTFGGDGQATPVTRETQPE